MIARMIGRIAGRSIDSIHDRHGSDDCPSSRAARRGPPRRVVLPLLALGLACGVAPAHAQSALEPMSDPNPLCLDDARDVGFPTLPFSIDDSLESEPPSSAVDFFRFEGTPGQALQVRMLGSATGSGSLPDPFLGLFDDQCRLLLVNDDAEGSLNSLLEFVVPDGGTFVIAAAKYPDAEFDGSSFSDPGTYQLLVAESPPLIDSISVQVVNRLTGAPIPGDRDPFAFVELYRCDGRDCNEYIGAANANDEGRVTFTGASFTPALKVGTYLLRVRANDFGSNESGRFTVAANQAFEVWDVALTPPPISIGAVSACEAIPPQGGTCTYDVTVDNNTSRPVDGLAWSLVDASGIGVNYSSRFEASTAGPQQDAAQRAVLAIPARSSATASFSFEVPSFVPEGAQFCQSAYLGLEPSALLNVIRQQELFCIQKSGNRFVKLADERMTDEFVERDEQSIDRRLRGRGIAATK